jgi:uncharacterized membrane protein
MSFSIDNLYFSNLHFTGQVGMWIGVFVGWLCLVGCHYYDKRRRTEMSRKRGDDEDIELVVAKTGSVSGKPVSGSVRYIYIDLTRGLAISFVVYFHYMWNLRHNRYLPPAPFDHVEYGKRMYEVGEFWIFFIVCFIILSEIFNASMIAGYAGFAYVTAVCINWHYWASQTSGVGMIMYCVGLSSYVQNRNGMKWKKIFSRIQLLVTVAACISAATYIVFGFQKFVYFGAIHCIALVSILHIPFVMYPFTAVWGAIFVFSYLAIIGDFFLEIPLRPTLDYMPYFENMGYLLIGIASGHFGIYKATHYVRCIWGIGSRGIKLEETAFPFLGRHSLLIFVAHQIVLYPLIKAFALLV